MTVYVGLLRAVNLGGESVVRMDALREALSRMGFTDVRTLLQSGNVVFESERSGGSELETLIEARLAKQLGLPTEVFLRSAAEWSAILARNPFPAETARIPQHVVMMALKDAPAPDRWKALTASYHGPESIHGDGRQAYLVYPEGIGRSRLTTARIEKHLETRGTFRNWNTVTKLARLATGEGSSIRPTR